VMRKKRSPRLRWRLPMSNHVLGDRCLTDLDPELKKLAMDPWRSPQRIRPRHLADQVSDLLWHIRPSRPSALPSPVPTKPLAMPTDDGLGSDKHERFAPVSPEAKQERPEDPILVLQSRLLDITL
jgi:hypothetical protein